ncbi:MAG: amidohydrolase family protein [Pseudomonadota bacterium]
MNSRRSTIASGPQNVMTRRHLNTAFVATLLSSGCGGTTPDDAVSNSGFEIIDFHSHALPPALNAPMPPPGVLPQELEEIIRVMGDPERLRQSLDAQGVNRRIINAPLEALPPLPGELAKDRMGRINDTVAALCETDPRLLGLASIDAYAGDVGARELERAVAELGMVGAFVESARDGRLISAPEARPTLATAAALGVPVFVHPVNDMTLSEKFNLNSFFHLNLGRASITSAALADMIETGVYDALPDLRTCFSSLALSAILSGGLLETTRPDARDVMRQHVYVDTVGVRGTLIRALSDVLGVERIMVGTDWPVFSGFSVRDRFIQACAECGFDVRERNLIAHGNARRLFNLDTD